MRTCLVVGLLFMFITSYSNIRLPAVLGNNMVLQQRSEVKLWGWGEPNEKVTVTTSWDNKTYPIVTVTGNADWMVMIGTPAAGGPYSIRINDILLSGVLIGEVWICGGQSNMEMCGKWGLQDVRAEYATAHLNGLRFFHVAKASAPESQRDCTGSWEVCDSTSLPAFSAVAYFFGKQLYTSLHVPIGLIQSCWSGSSAEVWTPESVIGRDPVLTQAAEKVLPNGQVPYLPGYAYNAMIAPITNYSLAGAIWYQGENNTMTAGVYPRVFAAMADSWRKAWGRDLPFYYVQVAPFRYQLANVGALMREAQTKCLAIPNTGMVVTTDLVTDVGNVHPSDKHDVGQRLANWALAETYHRTGMVYRSPLFKGVTMEKDRVIVYVDHAGEGLVIRGKEVVELYIAGEDRIFHPARATVDHDRIIARSAEVPRPVAVRYGFGNAAIGNIFSKEGLPLGPFRTDDWPVENEYPSVQAITNPVLNHDFPDPTIIRAGNKYYGYATNSVVEGKYVHIQLASSTDLVHWKDEGDALSAGAVWASKDFWAPHVVYDPGMKKYVMYYSAQSNMEGVGKCIGVAFADSARGSFVDMGMPLISGKAFEDIDPCAIIDPKSGKKLLYWGSDHRPIQVQELNDDWKGFKPGSAPKPVLYPGQEGKYDRLIEGAWIDYANGFYYLYYSGDNCCGPAANYAVMVARSKSPFGPFERLGQNNLSGSSVILEKNAEWTAPGHNSIFRDEKGRVYIAYHAFQAEKPAGRVLMISPLVYEKGWPVIKL
ncbi:MAG: family 43 glycosylhydrolase [Chitinophagaceae bacterium]|nr:family 43 glycosylhydrolase [Chitinophagaceae bacterium]